MTAAVCSFVAGAMGGFRLLANDVATFVSVFAARWMESLLVISYVGGWALVTWGLARLLVVEVWMISGGLFLLSMGGLGLLKDVAVDGLYMLHVLGRDRRTR